jgi:hypothetical protein
MSIRKYYEDLGVQGFYTSGIEYLNNHSSYVESLLLENHKDLPLDNVLDLACGGGLVTKTLQSLGYQRIEGIDPYLSHNYTAMTGCRCYELSFKDIIQNTLNTKYSCIICSFALHLCERSMLPSLVWRLSEMATKLVVISPSKFPYIGKPGVERFSLTPEKKRVHYRVYDLPIISY